MEGRKYEVKAYGPDFIYQGETGYFQFYHYSAGVLADPATSYKVAIKCLEDNQVVVANSTTLTKDATGTFSYSYACSETAQLGWYMAQAIMTSTTDVNMEGVVYFQVKEAA